jgi:hypothetical protein
MFHKGTVKFLYSEKEKPMKKLSAIFLTTAVLTGWAGMTQREQNTYVGAAIGSILFVPGALIGGYIGHNIEVK